MGLKSKLFGLGAALTMGLTLVAPAMATTSSVGNVPISVGVTDAGGSLTLGINTTSVAFGSQSLNAAENTASHTTGANGVKNAGSQTLTLEISNDVALVNTPFDITIRLDDGGGHGAFLAPTGPVPAYEAGANVQIPGRYLKITDVGNPDQAKFSGGATSGCTAWDGTGSPSTPQCAPREAVPSTGNGLPIYKTSDPVGLMGVPDSGSGPCRNTSSLFLPWPSTGCGEARFVDATGKLIMHFRAGSGTVDTLMSIKMTLDLPAGLYPDTYTGVLTIEKVTS
jgi:hypothetical protein